MRVLVATGIAIGVAPFSGSADSVRQMYAGTCGIQVLPRAPAGLPAPVEIWTKCGWFLVAPDGTVSQRRGREMWFQTAQGRRPRGFSLPAARMRPRRIAWDSGFVWNRAARKVAFTVTEGYAGYMTRGYETVYLLERGNRRPATLVRHRVRFTLCGRGVELKWRGAWLLYAAGEGHAIAFDTQRGTAVNLTQTLRKLPGTRATSYGYRLHSARWA